MSAKKTSLILPFLLAPAISLAAPAVLVVDYQKAVSSTPAVSSEAEKQKAAINRLKDKGGVMPDKLLAALDEARERTDAVAKSEGKSQALDAISKIAASMGASAVIDKTQSVAFPPSLDITSRVERLLSDPSSAKGLPKPKPSKSVSLIFVDVRAVGEKCGSFKAAEEFADRAVSVLHDKIREDSRSVPLLPENERAGAEKAIRAQLDSLEARRKAIRGQALDDILFKPFESIFQAAAKSGGKGEPPLIGFTVWVSESSDITSSVSDAICRGKPHPPIVADTSGAEGVVHANGPKLLDFSSKAAKEDLEIRLREMAKLADGALSSKGSVKKGGDESCRDCQKLLELEQQIAFAKENINPLSMDRAEGIIRLSGEAEASARDSVVIDNSRLSVMGGIDATESIIRRIPSAIKHINRLHDSIGSPDSR